MTYTTEPKCTHCNVYPAEENGWCKKCVGVFGTDYLITIAKSHGVDRIEDLKAALREIQQYPCKLEMSVSELQDTTAAMRQIAKQALGGDA